MQSFGEQSRQLIKVIQGLDSLGIDATLPSLPKFVVVGDQSHGKSSIIEAVCDITLPRAAGTCTRCPFRITTTASKDAKTPWSCKISLLCRYRYNSKANREYPKWEDTHSESATEFATIYDKRLLENALRLAQIAILNPHLMPAEVLQANNLDVGMGVGFSPNIVSLDIEGPELPELALIDLPGAINVAPNET